MSGRQEEAIAQGPRGQTIVGRRYLGLRVCPGREGAPVGKRQPGLGMKQMMRARVKVVITIIVKVIALVIGMVEVIITIMS